LIAKSSVHTKKTGFHFANRFVNEVVIYPFGIHQETRGRCGEMAYVALDCYFAGLPIPTHTTEDFKSIGEVTPNGSTLSDYIMARLLDSFRQPTSNKYLTWTQAEDHVLASLCHQCCSALFGYQDIACV
jgi:hypothetical protein